MARIDISRIDAWLQSCRNPEIDPTPGMAEAGLLEPLSDYRSIAQGKAALVERTGLPGIASVWGGRQLISRFFIDGFGNAAQRAAWRGRALSVAISEPKVGAHPKHLTTQADADGDGYRITGAKAWVSNGPSADMLIVLAITSMEGERKRYSMFLVPRDAVGLTVKEMPKLQALSPSQHCTVVLDKVYVPKAALLGEPDTAYESMALPFRDVEDAVGTFSFLGAFRFLQQRLSANREEAALSLGGMIALSAVFADAAEGVVAALDANCLAEKSATLVGLRVLAEEWVKRARSHHAQFGPSGDGEVERLFADLSAMSSVARGPRMARQAKLAHA